MLPKVVLRLDPKAVIKTTAAACDNADEDGIFDDGRTLFVFRKRLDTIWNKLSHNVTAPTVTT